VVEEIIARINNSIISLSDLKRSEDQLAAEQSKQEPGAADNAPKQQDLLRDLIDSRLLAQKAEELGISADTDVIKRLDELRKQMHAESMEDLEKAAQAQGVSFEEFKQNLKESILTQKVIQQEVGQHISVTQQEIQEFYNQHKSEMQRPEQVRLSEILISTQASAKPATGQPEPSPDELVAQAKARADAIYAQLAKGAKFDELAQKNSGGPTAAQGGDLEYFKRGTLSKQLEDQVFALNTGQFTEPIRTNQGWVILKVTEHQSEGVPPLKEVEPQIQERLYMSKMQPSLREYLTKLREDAYIDIKSPYIDTGASPNETKPVYTTASAADETKKAKKKKKYGLF
jgi:peptidyl-prolyl cis-trans isomerase SurA